MNVAWINIINGFLAKGILTGYKRGLRQISNSKYQITDKSGRYSEGPKPILIKGDFSSVDRELIRHFMLECFTVAGIGAWDIEEEMKKLAVKFINGEITRIEYDVASRKKMEEYGIGLGKQAPRGWLETNLNTAIVSSVNAARWNRLNDPDITHLYPGLQYKTQGDDHVRPDHAKLADRVFLKSDPIWSKIYPPNGWNCRCYVEPVRWDDPRLQGLGAVQEGERKSLISEVDPDFRRNAAESKSIWGKWKTAKLKDMPDFERAKLKTLIREYSKVL
jgi:hypothetical protein